jgi:hypothetical protein
MQQVNYAASDPISQFKHVPNKAPIHRVCGVFNGECLKIAGQERAILAPLDCAPIGKPDQRAESAVIVVIYG